MFSEKDLETYIKELSLPAGVHLNEIPDIELYMDQVIALFEKKLGSAKRSDKDKLITPTMINNYAKADLLPPPNKKRYSREHFALLILIYNLKQILPIKDIFPLLSPLLNRENSDGFVEQVYELYTQIIDNNNINQSNPVSDWVNVIQEKCKVIENEEREQVQWLLLVMCLVHQAVMQKRLIETIIDKHFSD